jgi:hypothetical protein
LIGNHGFVAQSDYFLRYSIRLVEIKPFPFDMPEHQAFLFGSGIKFTRDIHLMTSDVTLNTPERRDLEHRETQRMAS